MSDNNKPLNDRIDQDKETYEALMTRILGTELNLYNNQKFKAFVSDLTVNTPNTKVEKEIPAIIFGIKSWRFEKGKAP